MQHFTYPGAVYGVLLISFLLSSCDGWFDPGPENLGVLTVKPHDDQTGDTYCIYAISEVETDNGYTAYYQTGDVVCIACNARWPEERGGETNQNCFQRVRFESGDGGVRYIAQLITGKKQCEPCLEGEGARGYYYWPGLARRDIGQLTVGNISETSTYCRYTITAAYPNEGFEAFYRNGDQICIACGDSWPAGAAADGAQECPERIRFTAQSGDVQYDADKVLGVNSCTECPAGEVRGVYETP